MEKEKLEKKLSESPPIVEPPSSPNTVSIKSGLAAVTPAAAIAASTAVASAVSRPKLALPEVLLPSTPKKTSPKTPLKKSPKKPFKKSLLALLITLPSIFLVFLAVYIGVSLFFMDRFLFNTYINGINCTFLNAEEVDELIREQVENYQLRVDARAGRVEYIYGADIDLTHVRDGKIRALLEEQNSFLWPLRLLFSSPATYSHMNISYDNAKLVTLIDSFEIMNREQMEPPQDAYIEFIPPIYKICAEVPGTTLDETRTRQAVIAAVSSVANILDLDKADCYVQPLLFSHSPSIAGWPSIYNTYVAFSITYTFGDVTEVLDGRTAIQWVSLTETTPGELNRDLVAAWVNDFADRHDTAGKQHTITNGFGEEKPVDLGDFGWLIDREAEIEAILAACRNRSAEVREPIYRQRAISPGMRDWGDTYIEVDITNQYMWYFVDGELILDSFVVTGNDDGVHNTRTGMFYIHDKKSPVVLVSGWSEEIGDYLYKTPVEYWVSFYQNRYGFHDAGWQEVFGGNRYKEGYGSGGCVNMPPELAEQLYFLVEIGCMVLIHY